jgi:hypothetical protein
MWEAGLGFDEGGGVQQRLGVGSLVLPEVALEVALWLVLQVVLVQG